MLKFLVLLVGLGVLAGCNHPASNVTLTLTPAAIKECGADTSPAALTVHWDASKAVANHGAIELWVNSKPDDQGIFTDHDKGTLWLKGRVKGTATTGTWMYPGSRITVTDAANETVLTTLDVPSAACQ